MIRSSVHRILLFSWLLVAALFVCPNGVKGQCIDFYDLNDATHVTCEYGLYSAISGSTQWSTRQGGVNYGMNSASSRHTIHNLVGRYDERTLNSRDYQNHPVPNGLLEVPVGEQKSVRLGNWIDGNANESLTGEAERITYTYNVTAEAPYLQIKYAVVWESPNHQDIPPRFSIEFLHADDTPAPVNCGEVDINVTAAANMNTTVWRSVNKIWEEEHQCYRYGWNHGRYECVEWLGAWINDVGDHDVYWQDWQTVGVSLESYIGQTIKIRVTSADCGYTAHFGYSYFTIRCIESNPFNPLCGDETTTNTFTAPSGFDYAWYRCYPDSTRTSTDPIATSQSIEVPSNRQLYECEVQTPGNALCAFRLYVKSEPRLPKAGFSIEHRQNCIDTLYLTDLSCVSPDHIICYSPHRNVDSVTWELGDGRKTKENLSGVPIYYTNPGTYTIRQTAKLTNGDCIDIHEQEVVIRGGTSQDHTAELHKEICAGDFEMFDNVPRTTSGTYVQHTPTAIGCDSITTLSLTVRDTFFRADTIDLLEGKFTSYNFHSNGLVRPLYNRGLYWDSCVNKYGCDSVYKLVLNVHPKHLIHEYDTICRGTSLLYHKNKGWFNYNIVNAIDTLIYDSLLTEKWGNDSVYCLHVHVKPSYHIYETKHFCARKSFAYHGHTFTESGVYDVHFSTNKGCDSIYHLTLVEDESPIVDTVAVITDKDKPYIWHGINCSGSGTYSDTLTAANGCDSIVRLRLTIYPTFFHDDGVIKLCKDSSMTWHEKTLTGTTAGTFVVWDSLKNVYGYDSVYKAILKVLPSYRISYSVTQAIGTHYYGFFGQDISVGGEYTHRGTTEEGCDSIVRLTISFKPTYLIKDTAYICAGKSHEYHKNNAVVYYTEEGVYWDSLKTVAGYDSVYRLQLYVNPVYTTPISATICEGATYEFFGTPLTTANTYTKTLKSHGAGGCDCDSTIVLTLNVNPSHDIRIDSTICEGESVLFGGTSRTTGGVYVQSHKTKNGCNCDSIETLNLTVNPKLRIYHTIPLCEGESWYWKRKNEYISTNRDVSDTTTSKVTKCDRIDIWNIYVHPVVRDTVRAAICLGKTYPFRDHTYTGTTVGNDTITLGGTSIHGCDSLHTLILTVNPTYYEQRIDTSLCLGDYITIHNKTYSRGGTYYDTLKTEGCHCDSAFIINVEEHPRFFTSSPISLCKDSTMMWRGKEIKGPGTYYDSLKSTLSHGVCDSIYELIVIQQLPKEEIVEVTILSTGSYSFNGESLKESGIYRDTLHATTGGCDSIVTLILTVKQVYTVDTTITICRGAKYTFNGKQLEDGGLYTEKFISKYGTDSVVNLTLVVLEPIINQEPVHITDRQTYTWHRESNNTDSILKVGGIYDDTLISKLTGCDSINRLVLVRHQTYEVNESAEICKGRKYNWHNQTCDTTGDYYDTLKNAMRPLLDSIYYHLHLTVNPIYRRDTSFIICEDEGITFESGKTYYNDGTYYDTLKTKNCECDSIYKIKITKITPAVNKQHISLCKDSTWTWEGHKGDMIIKGGEKSVYYDTIRSKLAARCDSIRYELHVTTLHPKYSTINVEILSTDYYYFGDSLLNKEGTYYDTLPAVIGACDSIVTLKLTVKPVYNITDRDTICRGEILQRNGKDLENGGLYKDTLLSAFDTDSIVNFYLVVYEPRIGLRNEHISDKDTLPWTKHTGETIKLTEGGIYDDTIPNGSLVTGCDSISRLQLSVHPTYAVKDTASFCKGKSYIWQGHVYREAGDYQVSYRTDIWNYDSIHYLHLTESPTHLKDTTFTICGNEEIIFTPSGKHYSEGGTHYDTLKTTCCGCDSVYRIKIDKFTPFFQRETMILCKDSTKEWIGHNMMIKATQDTICYDSTTSVRSGYKCDSIHELRVIIRNPEYTVLPKTILSTSYYYFNEKLLNEEGTYYDTVPAVNNTCDSIIELRLTVLPVYTTSATHVMCRGESYLFKDTTIETSGLYTRTFRSVKYGTDSIVNLHVTVYEPAVKPTVVHINDKQTYTWHRVSNNTDSIVSVTGMYDDTIKSKVTGCDSINRLQLFVHKTYLFNELGETCEGKPFRWRGNDYPASTSRVFEYYDSLTTKDARAWIHDSVYHLTLTINPIYRHDTTVSLCEGDYYDLNGTHLYEGGIYNDTIETVNHCDNAFRVQVKVRTTRSSFETQYICPGGSCDWRGKTYTVGNEYVDTLQTTDGKCDSIYYHLTLRVKTKYEKHINDKICSSELPYDFYGRLVYESGVYDTTFTSITTQCDSIIHVHLTVNDAYDFDRYDTICRGQSVLFDNVARTESGIYVYQGTTKAGCDSVVRLHLTVIEKQNASIEKHICEGDYFELSGIKITESGTYTETATSQYGCDSTTTWNVTVHRPIRDTAYESICAGEEYKFHDVIYRKEGIYVQENKSHYNCDSTHVLVLSVNPVYRRDTSLVLCEKDYFTYNGHIYSEGGYYQDTARTKGGCNCDSILNITITKYPVVNIDTTAYICHGEFLSWHGRTYSRGGYYYDTLKMNSGLCDSIIYGLHLVVSSDFYQEQAVSICDDNYLSFRGHTYNQSGIYYDSLTTSMTGCDSVYCVRLTVNPTYRNVTTEKRCDIEPYWYNGRWLNETGDYAQLLKTSCGCDSINILQLLVTPTKRDTINMNICDGNAITYMGRAITQTGTYRDTINQPDINLCEIKILEVSFYTPTIISNVIVDNICADDAQYRMRAYYSGTRPTTYSLEFEDRARAEGFQNIQNAPFEDVIIGQIPQFDGSDYVRPDYYKALLTVDNTVCSKTEQAHYEVQLLVRYPSWIIEQNWNDVVALLNENYNGGYRFSKYEWMVNNNTTDNHLSYLYLPTTLGSGDEVAISLTREGETYAVPSCPIIIYDKSSELVSEYPVLAHPTEVRGQIRIVSQTDGEYTLYTATGTMITRGRYNGGEEQYVQTHVAEGCYLLRLSTPTHGVQTKKIILR